MFGAEGDQHRLLLTQTKTSAIVNLMVNLKNTHSSPQAEAKLDTIFSALADPTRRRMLARLSKEEMTVKALSEPIAMSKPAISKHLKVLENAGLLRRVIVGREHHCRLEAAPMSEAARWIQYYERFWNTQLDALDTWLAEDQATQGKKND